METILCAAIWYNNEIELSLSPFGINRGWVICGHRHAQIKELYKSMTGKETTDFGCCEGFLTSDNRFVTRERAADIAFRAGQTKEKKHSLLSDNIY